MQRKENKRKKRRLLLIASFIFIVTGISIVFINKTNDYKEIKIEEEKIEKFISNNNLIEIEEPKEVVKNDSYIAILDIPKINLKKGVYSKESTNNNIDRNILLLKESSMPDIENGNLILAGHSGNSKNSYFKNLKKLNYDELAFIHYRGIKHAYKLVSKYEIIKNGEATIHRNMNKNTLTLITCKDNSNKQIVFIFELIGRSG